MSPPDMLLQRKGLNPCSSLRSALSLYQSLCHNCSVLAACLWGGKADGLEETFGGTFGQLLFPASNFPLPSLLGPSNFLPEAWQGPGQGRKTTGLLFALTLPDSSVLATRLRCFLCFLSFLCSYFLLSVHTRADLHVQGDA